VAKIFKVPEKTLKNIDQKVSFDDPAEQDVQYKFSKQKQLFDSTTVEFSQTYLNLPIWHAGVTVTVKHTPFLKDSKYQIIHAVNTSQKDDIDAKLPPSNLVERQKKLFNIEKEKKEKGKQKKSLSPSEKKKESESSNFVRSLINKNKLKKTVKKKIIDDNAHLIRRRLYVYKYDKDKRLPALGKVDTSEKVNKKDDKNNTLQGFENIEQQQVPILPLYPVDDKIKHGHYYVVDEITFSYTTEEYGAINWIALIELETKSVLYLRALAANVNGQVFKHDPFTISGNPVHSPAQSNEILNPFRTSEVLNNLNLPVGGIQSLSGTRVNIINVEDPNIAPPTNPTGADFNYNVRTNNFAAVNAYYHTERFLALVESLGFPISFYFDGTAFPLEVDHRGLGNAINAHCVGNGMGGIGHCCYALADSIDTTNSIGIANDWRVVLHEVAGHGILYEFVESANFDFSHSAGDSFAIILSDPESQISSSDRFKTFPWIIATRRCDRNVTAGWAWGGPNDQPFTPIDPAGYLAEQILATTHFRIYRSIGGDSTDTNRKRFASRMMAYLILRAISTLTPATNPDNALGFADALMAVDLLNWTTEGVFGGAYNKVIRWSFEKQGLYQPPGAPLPPNVTTEGSPPPVDVYIDDGRQGEYQFQPIHWNNTSIWNRRMADSLTVHERPIIGLTNYIYVKIKNRGTEIANNVKVRGYHNRAGSGLLLPDDIQPLTTAELSAGTSIAPNNTEEKIIGPFEWIPEINANGFDSIIMVVSADNDASNIDNFTSGETIPDWRLVPNDNNIGQRNMVPVLGLSQIKLTVTTGTRDIDGDNRVFLGFGGREFRCRLSNDNDANPFHLQNNTVTLLFGSGSNVEDSAINDPRNPLIDVSDANNFPVYVRIQPKSNSWDIVSATVETVPHTSIFSIKYPKVVVGDDSGEIIELVK
jgi:zinc metalloprotease ZmpB